MSSRPDPSAGGAAEGSVVKTDSFRQQADRLKLGMTNMLCCHPECSAAKRSEIEGSAEWARHDRIVL